MALPEIGAMCFANKDSLSWIKTLSLNKNALPTISGKAHKNAVPLPFIDQKADLISAFTGAPERNYTPKGFTPPAQGCIHV